jgi:flagellar protein FliO/FliZ
MGPLIQTTLALLLVLGLIFGFAFLIRKVQTNTPGNQDLIHIKSTLALGPKERLSLIEIDGTWILIGITPHSINHLHTLPQPPQNSPIPGVNSAKSWLQTYLLKNKKDA